MAKGSVRKKGKKWYYRFYVEDESGRQVQRVHYKTAQIWENIYFKYAWGIL